MRLSTEPDRDEARALATLHAALDAGVTLLDTADAYGGDSGEEARRIVEIASVQVEMGPWHDESLRSGVAAFSAERGIRLLAYRPLGGAGRRRHLAQDPVLRAVAERHGATPAEVVLAWLCRLAGVVVPLPGPTQPESALAADLVRRGYDRLNRDELGGRLASLVPALAERLAAGTP